MQVVDAMGETEATTEATLSAINESLLQLTMKLRRIAARQDQMLVTLKNTTAALTPTATTRPESVPGQVMERQTTKSSSPSLCSANQIVSGGAPDADAGFASATPVRCSTLGSPVNIGSNHATVAFSPSGTMNLHATTSISSRNNTLQGVVGSGANMSAGCSTSVLSCPPDDSVALTLVINIDISAEVLTHVGGFSLFQELEQNSAHEGFSYSPLKDVLWYEELTDCVFTHIGCSSLFLEQNMDAHHELEGGLDKPTRWKPGIGGVNLVCPMMTSEKQRVQLSGEMQHVSQCNLWFCLRRKSDARAIQFAFHQPTNLRFFLHHCHNSGIRMLPWDPGKQKADIKGSLIGLQRHAETCVNRCKFCVISRSRKDAKSMKLATDCLLDTMLAWGRGGFSPGGFSSGHAFLVLISVTETWIFYSQVQTNEPVGTFSVIINGALFFVTSGMEVSPDCLPIILARFGTSSLERLPLFRCALKVAQTAPCILLNLTLGEAVCRIQKSFQLVVRPVDMFQNLYLGNSIQVNEGSVCVVVVESQVDKLQCFCGNFQCPVQLQDHSILGCPCLNYVQLERTCPPVMEVLAYLCSVEVQVTCRSVHTLLVDSRLVGDSSATTKLKELSVGFILSGENGPQESTKNGLGCYFHMQFSSFEFNLPQLCNVPMFDRFPWDPGGVHGTRLHAIAWGQAMFCRGGSVTPGIPPGPHSNEGLMYVGWARLIKQGEGRINIHGGQHERHRTELEKRNRTNSPRYLSLCCCSLCSRNSDHRSSLTSPIIAARGRGVTDGIRGPVSSQGIVVV